MEYYPIPNSKDINHIILDPHLAVLAPFVSPAKYSQ